MFSARIPLVVTITVLLVLSGGGVAASPFDDLVGRVPAGVNAIMTVDVEGMYKSEIAVKGDWQANKATSYVTQPILLPPDARRFLMATKLDTETLAMSWGVVIMDRTAMPSLPLLARAESGRIDKIAETDVVWSPHDIYYVKFSDKIMGGIMPANRQSVTRWITQRGAWKGTGLSSYLGKVLESSDAQRHQVVMAVDLEDLLDPAEVLDKLRASPTMANHSADLEATADIISSIKGVALGIKFTDKASGTFVINFGKEATGTQDFIKPLLLETFDNLEINLKDFESWTASVTGNRVRLTGDFSRSGLSLIASLLEFPTPRNVAAPETTQEIKDGDRGGELPVAKASQQYFQSVSELIDAVQEHPSSSVWMRKTVDHISDVPVRNVDPELLAYGVEVSDLLLTAADKHTESRLEADARQSAIKPQSTQRYSYRGSYHRGYRGSSPNSYRSQNYGERQRLEAEGRVKASKATNEMLRKVAELTAKVRATMAERYSMEF